MAIPALSLPTLPPNLPRKNSSMFTQRGGRAKTAPSQYPRLPFQTLRVTQLVSSIVVGAIMIYFIHALATEEQAPGQHFPIPWTFIFLLASSLLSVVALAFTMSMHCCVGLNPKLNLTINGGLSLLWGGSWAVLTWFMSPTLAEQCSIELWKLDNGVMVCKMYKALFSFALFGFLSTLAAFLLDLFVRRQQTKSGMYRLHDIDDQGHKIQSRAFPSGLHFARSTNTHDYAQPEGQYKYDSAYIPEYSR